MSIWDRKPFRRGTLKIGKPFMDRDTGSRYRQVDAVTIAGTPVHFEICVRRGLGGEEETKAPCLRAMAEERWKLIVTKGGVTR